jgi:hypothetical protein
MQDSQNFAVIGRYYGNRKSEPTKSGECSVLSVFQFGSTFLDLAKMLAEKQASEVVIAVHGAAVGLALRFAPSSIKAAINAALSDLADILDGKDPEGIVRKRLLETTQCRDEKDLDRVIDYCNAVKSHQANSLAILIRGCNIGVHAENLDTIRRIFGARLVTAPTCPMVYVAFRPALATSVDLWLANTSKKGRRRTFQGEKVACDIDHTDGTDASSTGVTASVASLVAFATEVYNGNAPSNQREMELGAMWEGNTYHLAHEAGYKGQLIESK